MKTVEQFGYWSVVEVPLSDGSKVHNLHCRECQECCIECTDAKSASKLAEILDAEGATMR